MICYEMITNEKPFEKTYLFDIQNKLKKGYRPIFTKQIPDSYKKLIISCWSQNPSNRSSFRKIVHLLENNRGFITENVDEAEYFKYVNYINNYKVSFGNSKKITII